MIVAPWRAHDDAPPTGARRPGSADSDVRVSGLAVRYGAAHPVFTGVGFAVAHGESVALIGANGVGKSTLLKCCIGLVAPCAGEVRLFGRPVSALGNAEQRRLREAIGFVAQKHSLVALAVLVWAVQGSGWSFGEFAVGLPALGDFFTHSWPPSLTRIDSLSRAMVETFQMALVGTLAGVVLSVPLAILSAKGLLGDRLVNIPARVVVALFRTVPDLVWALIFVIAVGLGPFAGTLAIAVDTAGFCGRFFAEAMEDVDKGPVESLRVQGVRRADTIFCATIPAAMPAFMTTTLFALEKAARSSVILGLVGAGGIGLELKVAMDLFDYPTAATIILMVLALVIAVEQAGTALRARVIEG